MKNNAALRLRIYLFPVLFIVSVFEIIFSPSFVFADESVVDEVNITVPVSCTMSGTGMNTHNATINNGQYNSTIGETTMKAFCNDSEGFAIYTIGYTDDIDGKNVLTNSALGNTFDIPTGTLTSGDDSQWAMKLTTIMSPEPTYPIQIQNGFDTFHEVPESYTMVAKRSSGTDVGVDAEGTTLKSSYQAYISRNQPAGTYAGQVKYILVHPNYVDKSAMQEAITVIYDGNGLTFPDGSTTNTVKYTRVCKPGDYAYVGNDYQEVMTSNITTGGTRNGVYTDNESINRVITLPNADKIKVEIDYGIEANTLGIDLTEGEWDGDWDHMPEKYYELYSSSMDLHGSRTYLFDGDTVTVHAESWSIPESEDAFGFYAKVYPVYEDEQTDTTGETLPSDDCSIVPITGSYMETVEWHDKWTTVMDGQSMEFKQIVVMGDYSYKYDSIEDAVMEFIDKDYEELNRTTITLHAYNPLTFEEVYDKYNKLKTNGYYAIHELNGQMCNEVSVGEIATVIDVRDSNTYSIYKLSDGNCWLGNNLKLDPTNPTTAANMSSLNTNASDEAVYNYLHGGNTNNIVGWSNVAVSNPDDWPYDDFMSPYIKYSERDYYGLYYDYCAATVGTYCYYGGDEERKDATMDICPANWRLPTVNEYYGIKLESSILRSAGYVSPGYLSNETDVVNGAGQDGNYWTSEYQTNRQMEGIGYYGPVYSSIHSGPSYGWRTYGYSIRCVVR